MPRDDCEEEEEEEEEFFDSREVLPTLLDSSPEEKFVSLIDRDHLNYLVWARSPGSVQQRRALFMPMIGIDSVAANGSMLMLNDSSRADCIKLSSNSSEDSSSAIQFEHEIENLDGDEKVFVAGGIQEAAGSNQIASMDESERSFEPSASNQQHRVRHRRRVVGWLRRLGNVACISGRQDREFGSGVSDSDQRSSARLRVRVCSYRKQSKELSAVYMGQNFVAHKGAILAMKFSSDGEYLASGGDDGVVRVWKVMECPWSNSIGISVDDPSCIYFGLTQKSELLHLFVDKEQSTDTRSLRRRTSDRACVVIPQELFQLSEKPLHEFRGHSGDILDLAWSKDNALLSSSTDKTVRLWKLGCDSFIKVFLHNNYVTCIQFNPIDERYFVSGSIDGKARIWAIAACRVVDWIDVRHIVTAVCYRPDGKALVVGSILGDCRFYDLSDNNLQLDAVVSFQGRKRSVDKRITGFQFCPSDPVKLMVTSADSTVRILDGICVISKYKGLRNSGSRISAIFTSDGRRIVSASEDSNVYIWNHSNKDHIPSPYNVKNTWSSEHFPSSHASIAMPWPGFSSKNLHVGGAEGGRSAAHFSPSKSFTLWQEFFSEIAPKGSATWPEEKLPSSTENSSGLVNSQLRLLKSSWRTNTAHAWGQVIVTAGRDGKIRSFQNYGMPVGL
ncbi:Protein SPA1-RELATED 3 [Platanthera zijinensis]|uniref:Protein SPA1-RELATED 3 n=1 Tax=Platanthera zijinensis TaxID=2320716 RepID=A0AAP0BJP7_9ASPA